MAARDLPAAAAPPGGTTSRPATKWGWRPRRRSTALGPRSSGSGHGDGGVPFVGDGGPGGGFMWRCLGRRIKGSRSRVRRWRRVAAGAFSDIDGA